MIFKSCREFPSPGTMALKAKEEKNYGGKKGIMAETVVAKTSDLKPGQGKTVEANGKEIALFNVGGKFYAISNTCAHQQGPLGEGELEEKTVTCPLHGWQYDVTSGLCTMPGFAKVDSFKVTVKGDEVFVDA